MNESQIKIKIFLLRTLDILLLIAVFSCGLYAVLYSENTNFMATITLIGFFLVNKLGQYSATKIAVMNVEMAKQKREEKKYKL